MGEALNMLRFEVSSLSQAVQRFEAWTDEVVGEAEAAAEAAALGNAATDGTKDATAADPAVAGAIGTVTPPDLSPVTPRSPRVAAVGLVEAERSADDAGGVAPAGTSQSATGEG